MNNVTEDQILRKVWVDKDHILTTWDTYETEDGKTVVGYQLEQLRYGTEADGLADTEPIFTTIFEGTFACPLTEAIDSDDTVRSRIVFLTVMPREIGPEYFDEYTCAQLAWVEDNAERLWMWTINRTSVEQADGSYSRFEDVSYGHPSQIWS